MTLRPHARVDLDELAVFTDEPPGTTLGGTWHATATSVAGRVEGQLTLHVSTERLDAAALLTDLIEDQPG